MNELQRLRTRIDVLDAGIAAQLAQRFEVCRLVGRLKRHEDIPMMQPDRVRHVHEVYRKAAQDQGLPEDFARQFVELMIAATCALEDDIIDAPQEAGVR
ncbi:chorismate mutase [Streptomyces sp. NPDC051940]|uniref:chorismate mutase n=1 Tax=Streptomyces sp. NPDC051940 TaxID=3155675 RepID=UPI0034468B17